MKYLSLTIPGFGKIDSPVDPSGVALPKGVPTGGLSTTGSNAIHTLIELAIIGAIFLSIFYIVRGGINMMTSGGDKQRFQAGRERVRYAIIGLIVIFISFLLVNFIGGVFGVNLLNIPTPVKSTLPACPAPTEFTCSTHSSKEITGEWKNSTGGNYRLVACEEFGFKDCVDGDITSGEYSVVRNLKPATTYMLNVQLKNDPHSACSVPGEWSITSICKTNP